MPHTGINKDGSNNGFKKGHKQLYGIKKGDKLSKITREKIKSSLVGKTGSLARNWQGGKSKDRHSLTTPAYRNWRMTIFTRDNFTCQGCGLRGCYLEAHHIKSWTKFPSLRFDVENGVTLCIECHKLTDNYKGKGNKKKCLNLENTKKYIV